MIILSSIQLFKCCVKGLALEGFVPVQNPISGDDAEVQGAAAAINTPN